MPLPPRKRSELPPESGDPELERASDRHRVRIVRRPGLLAVHLNGSRVPTEALVNGRLHLDDLQDHNTLVVEALMAYSRDGEGLHRAVDPEDKQVYVYAMTFLSAARCSSMPSATMRASLTSPDASSRAG